MLHLGTVNPDAHRRLGQHATVHTRNSVLRPLIRATQQGTATSRKIEAKWGSCNRETRHIWFNAELAKKHPDCLEYIVVHEMTHYFERNHGERFTSLMDQHLPDWRSRREQLNAAPLGAEEWTE